VRVYRLVIGGGRCWKIRRNRLNCGGRERKKRKPDHFGRQQGGYTKKNTSGFAEPSRAVEEKCAQDANPTVQKTKGRPDWPHKTSGTPAFKTERKNCVRGFN